MLLVQLGARLAVKHRRLAALILQEQVNRGCVDGSQRRNAYRYIPRKRAVRHIVAEWYREHRRLISHPCLRPQEKAFMPTSSDSWGNVLHFTSCESVRQNLRPEAC